MSTIRVTCSPATFTSITLLIRHVTSQYGKRRLGLRFVPSRLNTWYTAESRKSTTIFFATCLFLCHVSQTSCMFCRNIKLMSYIRCGRNIKLAVRFCIVIISATAVYGTLPSQINKSIAALPRDWVWMSYRNWLEESREKEQSNTQSISNWKQRGGQFMLSQAVIKSENL